MKRAFFVVMLVASFLALLPASWRLADPFFTHPYSKQQFNDPVLLVCSNHVTIRWLGELSGDPTAAFAEGCTFNVSPEQQTWVERAVRAFPAPNPSKASWKIKVKQLGNYTQQIDLELVGDGIHGMIYEASRDRIVPLQSRGTGPLGALFPLGINLLLWALGWCLTWLVRRSVFKFRDSALC